MVIRRRGFAHRFIALLLAAMMPLCCCVMNSFTGGGCCSEAPAPLVEAPSCCAVTVCDSQDSPDSAPAQGGGCTCCLKVPGPVFDWTVPVDLFGTNLPEFTLDGMELRCELDPAVHRLDQDASAPPWLQAAAMRGCVILNC